MHFFRSYWPWISGAIILIICILFIFWPERKRNSPSLGEEASDVVDRKYGSGNLEFPDAPHPFEEDPDLEGPAKRLWPAAFKEKNRKKKGRRYAKNGSILPQDILAIFISQGNSVQGSLQKTRKKQESSWIRLLLQNPSLHCPEMQANMQNQDPFPLVQVIRM